MYSSHEYDIFSDVIHFPCEVRILTRGAKYNDIYSGYFTDAASMWRAIEANGVEPKNVYFTINPVDPALLSRRLNRLPTVGKADKTTTDADIARIRSVVIDVDPVRPSGVPATEAEHRLAVEVAEAIRGELVALGFPQPMIVSSGNGAYVWFHADLDMADSDVVVKPFLAALAAQYDREGQVEVDQSVFNPARIMRVCGTLNMKGDSTSGIVVEGQEIPDRIHRMCQVLSRPEHLEPVPRELFLEFIGLTDTTDATTCSASSGASSVVEKLGIADCLPSRDELVGHQDTEAWLLNWFDRHGIEYVERGTDGNWIKYNVECPFCGNHDSDVMVNSETGALAYKCFHQTVASCSTDKKWQDYKRHYDPAAESNAAERESISTAKSSKGGGGKANQLRQLVDLANASFEFFPSRDGRCWAKNRMGTVSPIDSQSFHDDLFSAYFGSYGKAAADKAMKDALSVLRVEAAKLPVQAVHKRVTRVGETIYVDLGSNGVASVEATGWRVIPCSESPVTFYRPANSVALPMPVRGGSFELLREVSGCSDEGFVLFQGAVLDAYKGKGPYLLTAVTGEQGSAKSTLCRLFRRLVDPLDSAELSGGPRSEQDLCLDALNEHALVYDNISNLPFWLSDALCRICTGGGFKTRALYTNNEQFVISTANPICMNGIPDFVTANDLVSRSIMIDQPVIEPDRRITDAEINGRMRAAIPGALGGILDMMVVGLRDEASVEIEEQPRMIDTAKWVAACTGSQEFVDLLNECQAEALIVNSESSPLGEAVQALLTMREQCIFEGTTTELLAELKPLAMDESQRLPDSFPDTPKKLGNAIKRESASLKQRGIEVDRRRTNGRRVIRLAVTQPSLSA